MSDVFRLDAGRVRSERLQRLGWLAVPLARYQRWNWAWRMEIALRYWPVTVALTAQPAALRILDVGCGSKGGVTTYAPRTAVGVDVTFDRQRLRDHPRLTPVAASGEALPFADASFDAALCLDTLEHLAPTARRAVVMEMARVLRPDGLLIVGAPCGAEARAAEERMAQEFQRQTGRVHPKLGEHLDHAMWSADDLQALAADAAAARFGRYELHSVPNVSVTTWLRLRRLFDLGRPLPGLTHVQRLLLQPLFPWIAPRVHGAPAYRRIVFCRQAQPDQAARMTPNGEALRP